MKDLFYKYIIGLILLTSIAGCAGNKRSETVFLNGAIYTVDPAQPWVEALAVRDGVIEYVGDKKGVEAHIDSDTDIIDLNGKMLLPGFQDAHIHPFAGINDLACNLSDREGADEVLNGLASCIDRGEGEVGDWLFGYGWTNADFPEGLEPTKELLNAVDYDGPIMLQDQYGHSVLANAEAMVRAGIDKSTSNPQGGIIVRDSLGEPTGLMRDTAQDAIRETMLDDWGFINNAIFGFKGLKSGLDRISANGITSFVDGIVFPDSGMHTLYYLMDGLGMLNARAQLALWAYPQISDDEMQIERFLEMYDNDPESRVRINQIKFYVDGILDSRTAKVQQHYLGEPDNFGINYYTEERLARYAIALEPHGYQMHIHAVGDGGVNESLNALEQSMKINGDLDLRHNLIHLEVVNKDDLPRFAELGVLPNAQASYGFPFSDEDVNDYFAFNNPRSRALTPMKSFLDSGATFVLSSDWSGGGLSPVWGIQAAITRQTPGSDNDFVFDVKEKLSLAEAIKAYTLSPAYLMHQEKTTGSLETGKFADLVILDKNLFDVPVHEIHKTSVVATYLEGELIYGSPEQNPNK